jgi:hypothetical protein
LFRFKLRTLLIAWLVCGAWLGWWIHSARQQRDAVAGIRQLTNLGVIGYSFEADYSHNKWWPRIDPTANSWIPGFALEALGNDFFHNVVYVQVDEENGLRPELAAQLSRLENLRSLILLCDVSDVALDRLTDLRELRSLQVFSSDSDDASRAISRLPKLEALTINWGGLTGDGFANLARMRTLKSLTLDRMTDEGLAQLAQNRKLEGLYILPGQWDRLERITGKGVAQLAACPRLRGLTLKRSCITDDDLQYFARVTSLERLSLELGSITGVGFQHLTGLTNLKWVCLENAPIMDDAMTFLAQLPNLEAIDLRGTEVTLAGFEQLGKSPRLRKLVVTAPANSNTNLGRAIERLGPYMKTFLAPEVEIGRLEPGDMERLAQTLPGVQIVHYRDF